MSQGGGGPFLTRVPSLSPQDVGARLGWDTKLEAATVAQCPSLSSRMQEAYWGPTGGLCAPWRGRGLGLSWLHCVAYRSPFLSLGPGYATDMPRAAPS